MSISVCTDDVRLGTELWNWYCTRIERVYNIIKSAKAAALHKLKGINMSGLDTPPFYGKQRAVVGKQVTHWSVIVFPTWHFRDPG